MVAKHTGIGDSKGEDWGGIDGGGVGYLGYGSAGTARAVADGGGGRAQLRVEDNGAMAAVSGPIDEAERVIAEVDGYVVLANVNDLPPAATTAPSRRTTRPTC